jgi:hypothetical protein
MKIVFKKRILLLLLAASYLLFSYYVLGGWWNSSVGTLLILFFSYLLWNKDFLFQTGLLLDFKTIIKSVVLAIIIILCSYIVMDHIAGRDNTVIRFSEWRNYYHDVFYTLNEEIVLGAILLFTLARRYRMRPIIASVFLAIVFAIIHYVFYRWVFLDRGIIGITTLTTLFFIGFIRNSLILLTGHIGYSWALHFGWMSVMFGSIHINRITEETLGELNKFNTYLGSTEMLIISLTLAGIFLGFWIKAKGHFNLTLRKDSEQD